MYAPASVFDTQRFCWPIPHRKFGQIIRNLGALSHHYLLEGLASIGTPIQIIDFFAAWFPAQCNYSRRQSIRIPQLDNRLRYPPRVLNGGVYLAAENTRIYLSLC
jgi:hypothetical protein